MTEKTIEIGIITVPKPEDLVASPGERVQPVFRTLSEREIRDYLDL